jgi:hypothetical protein
VFGFGGGGVGDDAWDDSELGDDVDAEYVMAG